MNYICSYLQYANIAARALRNTLKDELKAPAQLRNTNNLKFQKWEKGVSSEQVNYNTLRVNGYNYSFFFY